MGDHLREEGEPCPQHRRLTCFRGSFCLETLSNGRCAVIDRAYSVDSATVGAVYDRHLEAQGKVRAGEKLERKGERNERRGEHLEKKGTRLEKRGEKLEKKSENTGQNKERGRLR